MWHTKVVKRYKTGESVPEDYVEDRSTPLVLSATAAQQRKQKMHAILTPRSTNDPFQDIDPSGPSVPFGPKSEPTSPLRLKSSDSGTSPQWFETGMELRKTEIQLEQIYGVLEEQKKLLQGVVESVKEDAMQPELHVGRKAASMLLVAEQRARELGHRSIGTGDILWAMFHDDEDSEAIKFLKGRGISRESVYASHHYSDNAGRILKLAAQRSSELSKPVVGTEDLLWAIFQVDDHTHSRSQAIKHLESRGVNMDLIWGNAELSANAQTALNKAVLQAREKNDRVIGREDLLEALFTEAYSSDSTVDQDWLVAQHVPPTSGTAAMRGKLKAAQAALAGGGAVATRKQELGEDTPGFVAILEEQDDAFLRMFIVGGLAGTIETFLVQPLVYWKTISQVRNVGSVVNSASAFKPSVMYRGVFVNALSIGPISAFQYGCNGVLSYMHSQYLKSEQHSDSSSSSSSSSSSGNPVVVDDNYRATASLAIAATTGALSSLIVTPAELLMISQQRSGLPFSTVVSQIWTANGASGFFRGFIATAAREAGWTFGFLGLAPVMKAALRDDSKFFNSNEVAASLTASIIAGQAAAILTQPFDTVKTLVQADRGISNRMRFDGAIDAAKHLVQSQGLAAFWRGLVPRSVRCVGAVFILGETQQKLNRLFDSVGFLSR